MSTRFIRVARAADIPPGTGRHVEVGDHVLAVFHHGGQFFVLDGTCPHQGGPLGEGYLDPDGVVTCPWHAWRFCVRDGTWCDNPRIKIDSFPVRVVGDEIQVHVPPRE